MADLDLARLARDVALMRSGLGPRRQELRQLLALVDAKLRDQRNIESLRLANIKVRIRMLDTRGDPRVLADLQATAAATAQRLEALDSRIVEAIAAGRKEKGRHDRAA